MLIVVYIAETYSEPSQTSYLIHYLLRYRLYLVPKVELLDSAHKFDSTFQNSSEEQLLTVPLYGSEKYASNVNNEILRLTISYLKASERFVQTTFFD